MTPRTCGASPPLIALLPSWGAFAQQTLAVTQQMLPMIFPTLACGNRGEKCIRRAPPALTSTPAAFCFTKRL